VSVETEWQFFVDGPDRSFKDIRRHLIDALELFPNVSVPTNLDMSSASSETQQFAKIMEAIKDYKSEEAP
jgi:hypothetical protein